MKKILIIGSHGMAGHAIKKFLSQTNKFLIFDIENLKKSGGGRPPPFFD